MGRRLAAGLKLAASRWLTIVTLVLAGLTLLLACLTPLLAGLKLVLAGLRQT